MLTLIGLLRLGALIRYIPHAVTVGFTCGIAVTIFASQLRDLGGLTLPAAEPEDQGESMPCLRISIIGNARTALAAPCA
jgi:SulP family sulfate permease